MPWIKKGINRIIPSVIWQPHSQVLITLQQLSEDSLILDIGAGGRQISPNVIGVDFLPFENTKLISDIHNLAFANESVDAVFCTGTLEHINNPHQAMREIYRILKPNGIVHIEVPFIQPFHKDPEDYWRWTLDGLRLFAVQHNFEEIRSGSLIGPASAMNVLIIAYFQSWFCNRYIRKMIDFMLSYILFPFKFLDVVLLNRNIDLISAFFYVGIKPKVMDNELQA
jgi:SAM-dependent methyltransferase